MYVIKIDLPGRSEGVAVEIDGLGIFKNGEDHEISDEQAEAFITKHVKVSYQYDEENKRIHAVTETFTFEELIARIKGVSILNEKSKGSAPVVLPPAGPVVDKNDEGGVE